MESRYYCRASLKKAGNSPLRPEHPAAWENLNPAMPGSRIDFVRYQIPPSTVLGPTGAHASGKHMHVAVGTVRVTVGDETAGLVAGDNGSCRTDAPHGVENPDPSAEALIYLIVERSRSGPKNGQLFVDNRFNRDCRPSRRFARHSGGGRYICDNV